jgi:hypothetical protein
MTTESNKTAKGLLYFSTKSYPTFGRSRKPFNAESPPETVVSSPYYWWYMFLRLNADYKKTCASKGSGKYKEIYKDLGNVHSVNFKEWWNTNVHLFAEPKKGYKMKVAKNLSEIAPFDDDDVLNLVVPLTWSQRSLKKAFNQMVLKLVEKGKPGVSVEASEAEYKLSGKWHSEALATAYRIYTIKKKYEELGEKKAWADIAVEAKLPMSYALKKGEKNINSDVRKTLTILAKRHFDRAEQYIASSVTKHFPYQK